MPESDRQKFQEIADRSNRTETTENEETQHSNTKPPIPMHNNNSNTMYTRNVIQQQARPITTNYVSQNVNPQMRGMGGDMMYHGGKPSKPAKDPNAPKKPLSAYFLYANDKRDEIRREFPEMSTTDVAKESGRRWAQLSPEEKEKYESRSKESKSEYDQAMSSYVPTQMYQQPATKHQKKVKDPNAPKPPLSAYFLFGNAERDRVRKEHPEMTMPEIAKQLGKEWATLSQEEKQPYQQKSDEDRQRYDREMAAYRGGGMDGGVGSPMRPSPSPSVEKQTEKGSYLEKQALDLPLV